jgi:hypothetical protein
VHAQDEETEVTPSVNFLDSEATTEEIDLFNNQGRILIMNIPNGMWEERGRVNLHAHNPNPQAPEHLSMVNNLTNDNAKKKIVHDGTNLTCITQPEWKKLRSRVIMLAEPMTHCCFQCGMLNHPEKNDTIIVDDIQGRHDCRAYRVFRYYIRKLTDDRCNRLPGEATRAERRAVRSSIFLCEPVDGGGCRVYTCRACKRLCRAGTTANNKPRYSQCSPADLDLFDGVDEDDDYNSIGIGDRVPSVYANLSCNDRMCLGVLKVMLSPPFAQLA